MLTGLLFLLLATIGLSVTFYVPLRGRSDALAALDRRLAAHVDPIAAEAPVRQRGRIALPPRMAPWLLRAQIDPAPQQIGGALGAFLPCFAVVAMLAGIGWALLATIAILVLAALYVRARARRRIEALVDSLPVYLDSVRQLMVVGNSLSQALTRALPAAADPVRAYLGGAVRRIELGAPVGESLQQLADRLKVSEMSMLAAAVRTNLRFGGPIASILANLAHILRERLRIKRELASATAEARVSTQMLILFPLLLIAFLLITNPAYRSFFFFDPRGHRLALFAASLQGIGIVVMLRMQRVMF